MSIQATMNDIVLSGHGPLTLGVGDTRVPEGVELVVLAPPGASNGASNPTVDLAS